ncbi:MAG TPA: acyl-CoA dehydrogenase family protein [Verrucomicrobiae bacterium]|jgi:alkylation response protein AidB-like acyl-CoA dehydrogenase|nr:acyl-CoA dehydrogenase family protein [Verrucomicrobiae bacterium]
MDILEDKSLSEGKRKALELAEDSREQEWKHPSFAAELFKGRVRWDLILPYPEQNAEDRKIGDEFLKKLEAVLREHIDPDKVDQTGEVPAEALKALAEIGCFAIKIPKEYGGLGMSQVNYNRAIHLVASYCSSTAVWLSAHQSIGVPQPLKLFGTDEQKKKYLPRFAKGAISAFALTEPDVGSDPAKMTTTAVPVDDGKNFIINGDKLWCTNGPKADILIVMAQTPPKVVNGKEKKQITAFIVERASGGIEVLHRCRFMGLNGIQNGLLRFKNVKVPRENIVGGEGQGLKIALTTLNTGRLTMPAAVTGGSKWCLKVARLWSKERVQWGHEIGQHEAVAHKIATMAATIFTMDAVTYIASEMADRHLFDIRLEAAMAKLCCTEASWKVVDGTLQIRGGRGYETGPSLKARGEKGYAVERMMRDARINTIIEGTSQIMRLFIAREAMDTHVRKIMPIMSRKTKPGEKLALAGKAFKFYSTWYPKQFIPASQLPKDVAIPGALKPHMKYIGGAARRLARNLFHAMAINQQKLESKQQLMSRLVNIGTDLFAMASACSKAIRLKEKGTADANSVALADLFCRQAKGRIEKQFRGLFSNSDAFAYNLAQDVLEGKYAWLENDIIFPA